MPANELAPLPFADMQALALSIARSGMFGIKTPDQALVLMSIAQAEGRHPALAARDYHVINGSPSKKAEAMLRDFLTGGGRVTWHELTDDAAEATFSHPQGGEAKIRWDAARVARAQLSNPMHRKFPRQMLRSRVVSEGVRTVWPMATGGMMAPEEAAEIRREEREPIDVTPATPIDTAADLDAFAEGDVIPDDTGLFNAAHSAAISGAVAFRSFWAALNPTQRGVLRSGLPGYQEIAAAADDERARDEDPFGLPPLGEAHEPDSAARKITLTGTGYDPAAGRATRDPTLEPASEAPAVPFAAAVRALVPVAGDDGALDWAAWSRAFVALVERATPAEARKCRLSDLPHYGKCRTEDGDAAAAVQAAVNAKSKEAPPP